MAQQDDKRVVLTAVGSDRPGLVSELSKVIGDHGANIEDSRMAVLGGEFALVLLFSGNAKAVEGVQGQTDKLAGELGLQLFFKETTTAAGGRDALGYRVQVTGHDHPGIVQRVTGVLSSFEVNVAALDTAIVHAPMTGTPTFVLKADIEVPASVALAKLRDALSAACDENNLDLTMEARV